MIIGFRLLLYGPKPQNWIWCDIKIYYVSSLLFLKVFCHFEFEANLGMILGVVDLGRCFESIFGVHLGWGRFGVCYGSKFGDVFGKVNLS
jgi:hypothetical protein